MRKLNTEEENNLRDVIINRVFNNEFSKHLGFEIMELNFNYSKVKMKLKDKLLNGYSSVHGGVLLALADTVVGITASMGGKYVTTLSCSMNFLLPAANTEYIYCECLKLKTGKHVLVYDIRITDDAGNLLDSGEYSMFVSKKSIMDNEELTFKK
ncbi:MAG: PaaI family thioesterase [Lachnospiraceae bacterium]|nr:PaaI family thioesterase [Lachnospiraceae bacterium]